MQKIFILFILVGVVTGPLYGVYCQKFSGEVIDTQVVAGPLGAEHVDDKTRRASVSQLHSVSFSLAPDMNPIGLNVAADVYRFERASGGDHLKLNAVMADSNRTLWKKSESLIGMQKKRQGALSSDPLRRAGQEFIRAKFGRFRVAQGQLHTFDVGEPGLYTLSLEKSAGQELKVGYLQISARRNVLILNKTLLFTGCALFFIGIAGFAWVHNHKSS